jgi:hypothetical protein
VAVFFQKCRVKPEAWVEQAYVVARAVAEDVKAVGGTIEDR